MNERLTGDARRALEEYLEEVRGTLRDSGVDAEEVSADVRDHVHEAIAASGTDRVDRDEVERVLARLGPPAQWLPEQDDGGWRRRLVPADDRGTAWLALAVFALTLIGIGAFPWVGPLILVAAWLFARAVLAAFEVAGRSIAGWGWLIHPPLVLVGAGFGVVLLFWPMPLLLELAGGAGSSVRAWAAVAAGVGCWWLVLGLIVRTLVAPFRWLLRPLEVRSFHGLVLATTGLTLGIGAGLVVLVS